MRRGREREEFESSRGVRQQWAHAAALAAAVVVAALAASRVALVDFAKAVAVAGADTLAARFVCRCMFA